MNIPCETCLVFPRCKLRTLEDRRFYICPMLFDYVVFTRYDMTRRELFTMLNQAYGIIKSNHEPLIKSYTIDN